MITQIVANNTNVVQPIEQTLALIKPSGMQFREDILQKISQANFKIIDMKICKLNPGQVSEIFKLEWHSKNYPKLADSLTIGPLQAMCLAKPNAIKAFLTLFGLEKSGELKKIWPCNLRACFGSIENDITNGLHGSGNCGSARWEIQYFFPDSKPPCAPGDVHLLILNILSSHRCTNNDLSRCPKKLFKFEHLSNPIQWIG